MNTPRGNGIEAQTATSGNSNHLVGMALLWPSLGGVSCLPLMLLSNAVEAALSRAQVETTGVGALLGADFMLVTAEVANRNQALRELRQLAEELAGMQLWEIAYFDSAEGIWRTVIPTGAAPFERFLSDSNLQTVRKEMALAQAKLLPENQTTIQHHQRGNRE